MSTYMTLLKYSQEGSKGISSDRTKRLEALCKEMGGKYIGGYGLLGEYDAVVFYEMPDTNTAMKCAMLLSNLTLTRTLTLPAVPIDQFDKLAH